MISKLRVSHEIVQAVVSFRRHGKAREDRVRHKRESRYVDRVRQDRQKGQREDATMYIRQGKAVEGAMYIRQQDW
mgnify:CR=1 FL=1